MMRFVSKLGVQRDMGRLAFMIALSAALFFPLNSAVAQGTEITSAEGTILSDAGAEGRAIGDVGVEGNARIEATTILAYSTLHAGDTYTAEAADLTLKTLFATGYFADIVVEMRGPTLIIRIVENPMINRVIFRGNRAVNDEDLTAEVELRPRTVYTRSQVQADVRRILEVYRRAGHFSTNVDPQIVQLPQNRIDLIFEVNDGAKTGVRRVNFLGNEEFSDRRLRTIIATEESRWWRILSTNDNYDPDRVTYDREQLRRFYLSKGYADFQVVNSVAELTSDRRDFFVTFSVEEGEQYTVGSVVVESELDRMNADSLRRLIPIVEGEVYNANFIDTGVDNLTFMAGAQGYAFVDVRPRVRRNVEDHTVELTFEVNEGPRVYIERINIVGNTRTLDRVIRREFRLIEGDAFNRVLIERSRARVRGLGFFESVEISEEPGSLPDRTVLNVEVEEQATGEISFGLGFSSTDAYVLDFSITERNLLGRGQHLRLSAQLSSRNRQVDIRFTEPYFMGRNLAAGFDVFQVYNDYRESNFTTETSGGAIRLGFPVSEYNRLNLRYTARREVVQADGGYCNEDNYIVDEDEDGEDDDGVIPIPNICSFNGEDPTWISLFGYTFNSDHRNDPINPTGGYSMMLRQDLSGLGGDVHYLRTEFESRFFYSPFRRGFAEDVVLSFRGTGGYVFDWGSDTSLRQNDRFYKGGASFRGFEPSGIGPRIVGGDSRSSYGGRAYGIGTAEIGFPMPTPESIGLDGALFADFGTVGLLTDGDIGGAQNRFAYHDDLSIRASVGLSLFWDSPFGPVRLDFAHVLAREDYDIVETFRFSGGTRF